MTTGPEQALLILASKYTDAKGVLLECWDSHVEHPWEHTCALRRLIHPHHWCPHQWEVPDSPSITAELIRGTGQGGGAAPQPQLLIAS